MLPIPSWRMIKFGLVGFVVLSIVSSVFFGYRYVEGLNAKFAKSEAESAVLRQSLEITAETINEQDAEIKGHKDAVNVALVMAAELASENDAIMRNRSKIEKAIGGFTNAGIEQWTKKIPLVDVERNLNANINGLFMALEASSKGELFSIADYMPETAKPGPGGVSSR